MSIPHHTLTTLEFPTIRAMLARHASFAASREIAEHLEPSIDAHIISNGIAQTREARYILDEIPDLTIGAARDVRDAVLLAERGGVLDALVLLQISHTLGAMRRLRGALKRIDAVRIPQLNDAILALPTLNHTEERIEHAINHDGEVLDGASAKLASLRSDIRITMGRVQERLQHIVSSGQYADALQESIVTVRNGRYVVPVKASHKRMVKGLVHDQSGKGITLYIEPLVVVELNNKLRELQLDEADEIARILAELSDLVGTDGTAIRTGVSALAVLDFSFAKARFAGQLRAVEPIMIDVMQGGDPAIKLVNARHPLIDPTVVVPVTITMPNDTRILLITGPNTGGKTVSLKTTGLLALMAQAGLFIPAADGSTLPIFGRIFADIGDEQSIEQSLSTFSSHMTNIIGILRTLDTVHEPEVSQIRRIGADEWQPLAPIFADELPALILFDELGAGTDPVEGSALARAIIEHVLQRGVFAIATTHYAELKAYAYSTAGVQNASVEFDTETLSPTYRLLIGVPGRSNALAIATRLGLDARIIAHARDSLPNQEAHVDTLLAAIQKERIETAHALQQAEQLKHDAEMMQQQLVTEREAMLRQLDVERQHAQQLIDAEVKAVRAELRRLRDDVHQVTVTKKWMEEAQQRAVDIQQTATTQLAKQQKRTAPPAANVATPASAPRPLRVGDAVFVPSVNLSGDIISIDEINESAVVQIGGFRMTVPLIELRPGPTKAQPVNVPRAVSIPATPDVALELDVRGMRALDACERVDRYIDDAYRAGLPYVRIIHGKGLGALRQALRDQLKTTGHVKSFEGGGASGGEGVTVVHLKGH
ncbi:MAG: endonuclease MutS2 [Roseiflexaceae bacterium]|jgi:DNA mismatch repair protein MutS2|nr:endonuclease MutS2 [Chloroflexaceae bacterium]